MKYFTYITNLEQAQKQYRKLAKKYHPDLGGTAMEFQELNLEYQRLLIQLQHKNESNINNQSSNHLESELMKELGKLAKVLVDKQVPQAFLKQKINTSESKLQKGILEGLVNILNSI